MTQTTTTPLTMRRNGLAIEAEDAYRDHQDKPTTQTANRLVDLIPFLVAELDEAAEWAAIGGRHREALARRIREIRAEQDRSTVIDAAHLARQRDFSERTFGPGARTKGVVDHIRKELAEIEADPSDLGEWVDVVILALDGAWRAGHEPQQIIDAVVAKQIRNEARVWPDWRTADPNRAIEHDRSAEVA
ncbi:DUF550 domain-containing protein [Micromonospora sp. WMMD1102]|uniref:dATP/dGTP pyrophosphohydrolase domain-containing protein n=1 Tax=Micromonospora sp. WMMD1102 TaxID=3016105 RepID=UPI0024152DA8|nr:dATP/dGTP pyrophosphohydrolase domain-containing protein [Micromonospora sp. WMMD1102]MDG4791987.1 DUF550 domain-containing protein [Micromonospora sp. WMMD1102]